MDFSQTTYPLVTDRKLTIAQVVCTYPPYHGGMGRVAFEYTERLRARGHNVHVFTSRSEEVADDPKYVHRIPSLLQVGNAGVMPSLYHRLKGFDLVHLHYPFFGGAEPTIIRKALRDDQGLVMTYHMDAMAGGIRGAIFEMHRRMLLPWLVGRVDRVLASSKDYIETSAIAQLDGALDRVEIHPFGVDLDRFHPAEEPELKSQLNIPAQIPVLLFVGGLDKAHHFKGVGVFLEALTTLKQASWRALIVGDGDLRSLYEQLCRDAGLSDRVSFLGSISDQELPRYYRMADVHVFPSTRRAEAFGIVALEAAASGTPTIASNLPGVRTVVLDGVTGLLVEPEQVASLASAISLFLEQPELRKRFGASARLHAEHEFAWDPLVTKLEQTYQSVIAQQSARRYDQTTL
jgi:glycosyltransferase involved in cell wall biosynthesis